MFKILKNGYINNTLSKNIYEHQKNHIFIFTLIYIVFPFDNTSIIQITLSDSEKGFLNGYYDATISVVDHDSSHVIWSEDRNIYFDQGFAELKLGPIDNLVDIVSLCCSYYGVQ